ncbi:hypothetical protein [Microbacterium sp. LWH3-1.2]
MANAEARQPEAAPQHPFLLLLPVDRDERAADRDLAPEHGSADPRG